MIREESDDIGGVGRTVPRVNKRHMLRQAGLAITAATLVLLGFLLGRSAEIEIRSAGPSMAQQPENLGAMMLPTLAGTLNQSGVGWGEGNTILVPVGTMTDNGGSASGWELTTSGVDQRKLLDAVTRALEITAPGRYRQTKEGLEQVPDKASDPRAWVIDDNRMTFGAFIPEGSPGVCQTTQGCDVRAKFTTPNLQRARDLALGFMDRVGVDASQFAWTSAVNNNGYDARVEGVLQLQGSSVPLYVVIDVSSEGIYSVNAFAARFVKVGPYQIAGPRTVAQRTSRPEWAQFGPTNLWDPPRVNAGEELADWADNLLELDGGVGSTPTRRNGIPLLESNTRELSVGDPVAGIGMYRLSDGSPVVLPTWEYAAADGTRWAMLAIDDKYLVRN